MYMMICKARYGTKAIPKSYHTKPKEKSSIQNLTATTVGVVAEGLGVIVANVARGKAASNDFHGKRNCTTRRRVGQQVVRMEAEVQHGSEEKDTGE